jgi:uncharacterized delta-60 repeat protein
VFDVSLQGDGKLLIAGDSRPPGGYARVAMARFLDADALAAGALDPTFGGDGMVATQVTGGPDSWGTALTVQADGRILATGHVGLAPTRDFGTVRYMPDGSLDPTFGGGGEVVTDLGADDTVREIAVQPDGRVVVGGSAGSDFGIVRYMPDGGLDPSFGGDGIVLTDLGGTGGIRGLAVQPDGRIVVAGFVGDDIGLARYRADGGLDPSFGGDGTVVTDLGDEEWAFGLVLQADGAIVIGGYRGSDMLMARYRADGTLDPTYGDGGWKATDLGATDVVSGLSLQADGKVVIAAYTGTGGSQAMAVARYGTDGRLDPTFGSGGLVVFDDGSTTKGRAIAVQPDGCIVVGGYRSVAKGPRDFVVVRLLPDGGVDASFAGGTVFTDFDGAGDDWAHDVAIQPDGKIVAFGNTGTTNVVGTYSYALARYAG